MSVYTKLRSDDERRTLKVLPELAAKSSPEQVGATGTDGVSRCRARREVIRHEIR